MQRIAEGKIWIGVFREECTIFFLFSITERVGQGIWSEEESIIDPHLKEMARTLPKLINDAWAISSSKRYLEGWRKWTEWCSNYPEVAVRPADPFFIALYYNDLVTSSAKLGKITTAHLGIRWGHIRMGYDSPTDHIFVKLAFEGANRNASNNVI